MNGPRERGSNTNFSYKRAVLLQTEAQKFCESFARQLVPFGARLNRVIDTLSSPMTRIDLECLYEIKLALQDIQYRYAALQERVENQQAYLLILGPLKSGKSTLMNAISGNYVSEVSSLPSYPALVYVKNGDQSRYQATDYDGDIREFADSDHMCLAIQDEHRRLTDAIHEAERVGEEFDPREHYPRAIQRLNIQIPAKPLATSGTVLIDTPGLYSRMKFGYGQVTREFRNTAACAIFVVKGDNLFFEKVFEEFEDLLKSFNRIFLVANIDKSKQDLQADGSLAASLESLEPSQMIEAFKSLSTSAALKDAIDDGRLIIYPIDLLSAASSRLFETGHIETHQVDIDTGLSYSISDQFEATLQDKNGFDQFLEDLTGYLNSSQYIQDFMTDSLRMADELGHRTIDLAVSESAEQLVESCTDLRSDISKKQKQIEAIEKLKDLDWSGIFWHLEEEKNTLLKTLEEDHVHLTTALDLGISAWLQTDGSWQDLFAKHLKPILANELDGEANWILDQLRSMLGGYSGGARLNMFQMGRLHQAGLELEGHLPSLLQELGFKCEINKPILTLNIDEVPLKRSLIDFVLFRKKAKVCVNLFGTEGEKPVPAAKKRKRLTGKGEEYLKEQLGNQVREMLPRLQQEFISDVLERYQQEFFRMIHEQADRLRGIVAHEISDCQADLKSLMLAIGMLEGTKVAAENLATTLADIQAEFEIRIAAEDSGSEDQDPPSEVAHVDVDEQPADAVLIADTAEEKMTYEDIYPELDTNVAGL